MQAYALASMRNYAQMALFEGCSDDQLLDVVVDAVNRVEKSRAVGAASATWGTDLIQRWARPAAGRGFRGRHGGRHGLRIPGIHVIAGLLRYAGSGQPGASEYPQRDSNPCYRLERAEA